MYGRVYGRVYENNNNNNNCLKSNIQCIEIRVQWTVHLIMCKGGYRRGCGKV